MLMRRGSGQVGARLTKTSRAIAKTRRPSSGSSGSTDGVVMSYATTPPRAWHDQHELTFNLVELALLGDEQIARKGDHLSRAETARKHKWIRKQHASSEPPLIGTRTCRSRQSRAGHRSCWPRRPPAHLASPWRRPSQRGTYHPSPPPS